MTKESHTESNAASFWDESTKAFSKARFPWFNNERFMENYRRQTEIMNTTQQIIIESSKSILQLQMQFMKQLFDQLGEQTKHNLSSTSGEEKVAQNVQHTRANFDKAIENAHEINATIAKSNDKIIDTLHRHINESLEESIAAAKKTKRKGEGE